ncbi:MAG: SDR family oxidoreductase [Desulfobulbaceae bacterium]|nr:SDR family oxidoreductase [Desulfobulbaceae bacterium]
MPFLSENMIVLLPGAARPIGRAIARRFAQVGARLVMPVFDWPESVADLRREFPDDDACLYWTPDCDLRSPEQVAALFAGLKRRFGGLNILINNIERGGMPVVHGSYDAPVNAQQWRLEFATTLEAKRLLFQRALPMLRASARPGGKAVVNISSIAALTGRGGPAAPFFSEGYSLANRAIRGLTEAWAREAAPDIRVNELMLGFIESRHGEGTRGWAALHEEERAALNRRTPLGRRGLPNEVAEAVYFLATQASYMTGTVLRMDGGYMLGGELPPPLPPGVLAADEPAAP